MAVGIINVNGNHGISCNLVKESAYFQGFIFSGIEWFDPFCWKDSSQVKKRNVICGKGHCLLRHYRFFESPPGQPERNHGKNDEPGIRCEDLGRGVLVMLAQGNEIRADSKIPYTGN